MEDNNVLQSAEPLAIAVVMDGVEDYGGQHGQATAIAIGMAQRGHRVCYLSRWPVAWGSDRVARLRDAGVEVLTPRWVGARSLRLVPTADDRARLRRLLSAAHKARSMPSRKLLRAHSTRQQAASDFAQIAIDLLHRWRRRRVRDLPLVLHVITRPSAHYLEDLRKFESPIVFSEFGRLALYELDESTARRLRVDAYTTDSPDSAQELERIERRPVSIIPCMAGFDAPTTRVPRLARRFAIANRLVGYKQTDVAIRAAAASGCELDVYGGGPEEKALHELIAGLDASGRIRMHGLADAPRIRTGLDAADGFISCSRLDGTPMSVLEAMSRGRPIVAYPITGIRTIVGDGCEGLYFDGSSADLASVLGRLSTESGLAARLGRQARQRWERELSPNVLIHRYEEVYREALAQTPASAASGT